MDEIDNDQKARKHFFLLLKSVLVDPLKYVAIVRRAL